jgi:hypothetical protein
MVLTDLSLAVLRFIDVTRKVTKWDIRHRYLLMFYKYSSPEPKNSQRRLCFSVIVIFYTYYEIAVWGREHSSLIHENYKNLNIFSFYITFIYWHMAQGFTRVSQIFQTIWLSFV